MQHRRKIIISGVAFALFIFVGLFLAMRYEETALQWLQAHHHVLQTWIENYPFRSRLLYILLFLIFIGFYLPGGILFMLLSGAFFSFAEGMFIASFANLGGAVIGFLLSRFLLGELVQDQFPQALSQVNQGLEKHGIFYLLILRVAPVIPSPIVNAVMGVTKMPLLTYSWVTLLGRIPMTALYVHLGAEFSTIDSLSDLVSFEILSALGALCLLMLGGHYLALRLHLRT